MANEALDWQFKAYKLYILFDRSVSNLTYYKN